MTGPLVRIALRYGIGGLIGYEVGDMLASDSDVVMLISTVVAPIVVGAATEAWYFAARKFGWAK